jgi:hypothetical protein
MLYTSLWSKFELTPSVVIGTDCIGSWIYDHDHDNLINMWGGVSLAKSICNVCNQKVPSQTDYYSSFKNLSLELQFYYSDIYLQRI